VVIGDELASQATDVALIGPEVVTLITGADVWQKTTRSEAPGAMHAAPMDGPGSGGQ
jgi:hypothetical protein